MFLIKLAFKNLTRHMRRTLITAGVIAFGLFIFVLIDSLMCGIEQMSFDNIIDLEAGHVQVAAKAYWEENDQAPLDSLMTLTPELLKTIKGIEGFAGAAPRLKFQANLNNGIDELPILAIGVDPEAEGQVFTIYEGFSEGTMFTGDLGGAVLGKGLAELMGFTVGDTLTLVLKTKDGTFNTIDAEITGLLNTAHPMINDSTVFVPLALAQNALNIDSQVSEVVIRLNNEKLSDEAALKLNEAVGALDASLAAQSWKQAAKDVIAMGEAQDIENQVVIMTILIIAAVGIVNTIILAALERLEETGMMKAMGMREREIIFIYVAEAVGIGLLGGIMGCALGVIGVLFLNLYGIDLAGFGLNDMNWGIPIFGRFYGEWNLGAFVFASCYGFIVALLTSILPARWAARKDPVDAIYRR